MSEALRGVVVCHGGLAAALVTAAEQITGLTGSLVPVSNTGCAPDTIEARIADAIGGVPAVVFVDMPSGSCLFAAMHRLREEPNVKVVTGVNLAMLIDFVFHTGETPGQAAARAVATGERAIKAP
jgi:mannose/fructose-specific phosphotransferase system component IIA